jgi:ABC-type phosphate/phosphonate transport system substrate-binding protein
MTIANARMYSVSPGVRACWRALLERLVAGAGLAIEVVDHAPPAPIDELWTRTDKAAVLMCGLPFALRRHPGRALAAPVPSPARYRGAPVYWSDLVVRTDAPYARLQDTFGGRIGLTVEGSQSGCFAALEQLAAVPHDGPLYAEIVGPLVTPLGVITAVREGRADVGPVDSYAFDLLARHAPELCDGVRVLESTPPMPIPLIVGDAPGAEALVPALLAAHEDPELRPLLDDLLIARFGAVDPDRYTVLAQAHERARSYWRAHPFAAARNAAFSSIFEA